MEALSGFYSKPTIPSNPNSPSPSSLSSFSSSSYSLPHSHKFPSFKPYSPPPRLSFKRLRWRSLNCAVKSGADVLAEGDFGRPPEITFIRRKRLAVFVSGGGSNFKSIHEACVAGSVPGDIVVLVTNKKGCGGAEYARNKEIPVILFPRSKDEPDGLSPSDLVTTLGRFEVDFILLAGYLKLIPAELIQAYPQRILNIHPSLLPAFGGKGYYGMKVHKAVIASGARYTGPTIHFVDEHYDTGRILAQKIVPVLADDTPDELAARVLQQEHRLYVEVVEALCEERIKWREDGVPLIQSRENPDEYC